MNRKPPNYWTNLDNVIKELKPLVVNGKFPNYKMIYDHSIGILKGIRNFGGINEVAKLMGYLPPTFSVATDGHFVNSYNEYLLDEYLYSHGIQHEVNGLIAPGESGLRYDFKIGDIYIEIWGLSKGKKGKRYEEYKIRRIVKEIFYQKMGLRLVSIEAAIFDKPINEIIDYFQFLFTGLEFDLKSNPLKLDVNNFVSHRHYWTKDKVIEELTFLATNLRKFPTIKEMLQHSTSLYNNVRKYGGLQYYTNLLGFELNKTPINYWAEDKIIEELKIIQNQNKKFPSMQFLELNGFCALKGAIQKSGGMMHFRKIMKVKHHRNMPGHWNENRVIQKLEELIKKINKFPSHSYLAANDPEFLRTIIQYGGLPYFRNILHICH